MGIGRELAKLCAADGHDVVLVARQREQLEALADEIRVRYGVQASVIPCDLSEPDSAARLLDELTRRNQTIDILVNNAGFGLYGSFHELGLARQLDMLQVNIIALTRLTHAVLPAMVKRRFGRVMNMSSTASFQPGPGMAVYYASKAYVTSFSEALAFELRSSGVTVTALCPGPTKTNFQSTAGLVDSPMYRLVASNAERVARDGYRAMMRGRSLRVSGVLNWIGVQLVRIAPRFLVRRASSWVIQRTA